MPSLLIESTDSMIKDFLIVNVIAECSFVCRIGISDDFAPDLVAFTA